MAYCSNVETMRNLRVRDLQHAYTEKKEAKSGATEEAKTEEKLRSRDQKQRDLDESEKEARQSHVC